LIFLICGKLVENFSQVIENKRCLTKNSIHVSIESPFNIATAHHCSLTIERQPVNATLRHRKHRWYRMLWLQMANQLPVNATLDAAIARSKELEAQVAALTAQLASKKSGKIEVSMSEYSSGTFSIRGINRFPISFYPEQWAGFKSFLGMANDGPVDAFISSHTNDFRLARVASAYAAKLGKKWPSGKSKTDPEAMAYQQAYNAGKAIAATDPTMDVVR
jgi:hypothetical protein